jgi:ParB family chromosome partitioning protein
MQTILINVPLDSIDRSPYQMRQLFDEEEIKGLAASIKRYGLLHPLLLRPKNEGRFELISGERRLIALHQLGEKTAPALIRKGESEAITAEVALTENLQRVNLSPIEIAHCYKALLETFGLTQEELAVRLGKPRSTVANLLRLLQLPKEMQKALENEKMTVGHAKALLSLEGAAQERLFQQIISTSVTVRRAEATSGKSPHIEGLEKELMAHFGRKVEISSKGKGGTISFYWEDLDALDALLEAFGIRVTW